MLEPLIVLTVLNCFFMFSSTVTTCALWWQYRSHRCCFKKDTMQQNMRHNLSKSKNNSNSSKKPGNSRQDNPVNPVNRSKSNSTVNREKKSRRNSKHNSRSNSKYLSQNRAYSDDRSSSMEMLENWDLEDKMRMSEASQTGNDAKSAVVMEYSTVQKIVQILDNDVDLAATKMILQDLQAKQNIEEKKEPPLEPQLEPPPALEYTPVVQEQYN